MMDWQEVAIDGETHLKRLVDMYEELGFEVRLEEVSLKKLSSALNVCKRGGKVYTESMSDASRKPGVNERNRGS